MGLTEHAHHIAQLSPNPERNPGDAEDGEQGDAAGENDIPAESAAEFIQRMENFTNQAIALFHREGRTRDDYKDGIVYEERKRVLHEFVKLAQGWKRCTRCNA